MRLRFVIALLLVSFAWTPLAHAERQWIEGGPKPTRYEISIDPNIDAATFAGEARIEIRADAPASSVTLNALDLTIDSASIDGAAARVSTDADAQTVTLTPRRPLAAGAHSIRIFYRGKIYDDAYGIFRVTYEGPEGREQTMLNTMAEPGDARRFAPMWDQPDRRAVFALTVTAPAGQSAYSNMPVAEATRLLDGRTRVRFQDTPSMSSYLLFFAIGDLERIHMDVDGINVGIVARRGVAEQGRYALEETARVLRYYTDYFGIRYPLPKLDFIATPGAGNFGAMEHWGAILAFDQYLLLDSNASEDDRREVFDTVAHEVAHQWFGNLVTMRWWNDLWLNEGFAQWMSAKAMDHFYPEWQPWMSQLSSGTATAMSIDARTGTHPVVQEINTLEEANLAFDDITYNKGLAIIRMIEAYVGPDDFRDGVRAYLNGHLYGNTESNDLWRAVQAASGQPVLDIAHSFTTQPGYPVLQPSLSACTRNFSHDLLRFSQRRFALDAASRTGETWTIPIVVRALGGDETSRHVLPAAAQSEVHLPACDTYLVNAGQAGFFRVLYGAGDFEALTQRFAYLDAADQLGLLLDYWAFARSGDAEFGRYLDLSASIPADADPLIVSDAASRLAALADYARGGDSEARVRAYARERLEYFFARLGWTARPDEPGNDELLRANLITALGALGDDAIAAQARARINSADASIREAVMGVYGANATPAEYEDIIARASAANDFIDQRRWWLGLAGARDVTLARRSLDLVLSERIPRQIRSHVLTAVGQEHPRLAWDFLVAHRAEIEAMLDVGLRADVPARIASASNDPAMLAEVDAYAAASGEGARNSFGSAKAAIQLRIDTTARMGEVDDWIASRERRR